MKTEIKLPLLVQFQEHSTSFGDTISYLKNQVVVYGISSQMYCAFFSVSLIPFSQPQTSDHVWAAARRRPHCPQSRDLCCNHQLLAGALLICCLCRIPSFFFHLRAQGLWWVLLFFSFPWEFPIFLCLQVSLWETLAHRFLPLFFSFSPFHLFPYCPSPQGLKGCPALGPLLPLLFSAIFFNSWHCLFQLIYFTNIFMGKSFMIKKRVE